MINPAATTIPAMTRRCSIDHSPLELRPTQPEFSG
jgi:hypothetical protein